MTGMGGNGNPCGGMAAMSGESTAVVGNLVGWLRIPLLLLLAYFAYKLRRGRATKKWVLLVVTVAVLGALILFVLMATQTLQHGGWFGG